MKNKTQNFWVWDGCISPLFESFSARFAIGFEAFNVTFEVDKPLWNLMHSQCISKCRTNIWRNAKLVVGVQFAGAILHWVDINYPVVSTVRGLVACAAHCLLPCRYAVRCTISWDQPWSLLCALFWPRNELLGSAAISCQPLCCFWSYRFRNVLLGRQLESEALIHWYCCSGDALHKWK